VPKVSLQSLRTSLQDGGVSSVYINRLMAELDDHYADFEREERTSGSERPAAAVEALRRLGQQDATLRLCSRSRSCAHGPIAGHGSRD
jgi:hypothetical protein